VGATNIAKATPIAPNPAAAHEIKMRIFPFIRYLEITE
jgi:hypothetical protein